MKKNLLMLTCSMIVLSGVNAYALTPEASLKALKEVFVTSFNQMDDNKDGVLDQKEYLKHQFERFRSNIIEADSFDTHIKEEVAPITDTKKVEKTEEEVYDASKETTQNKPSLNTMGDSVNIMQAMADYTLEDEYLNDEVIDEEDSSDTNDSTNIKEDLTFEQIDKAIEQLPELSEDIMVEDLNEPIVESSNDSVTTKENKKDTEINKMLSVVKQTLPKQIDEITKWVDIKYQDKMVSYIYKAEVDTISFSDEEMKFLTDNIKNDACVKAYENMCPKIKPVFIDEGINLRILYTDKNDKEIGSCEFNEETCE